MRCRDVSYGGIYDCVEEAISNEVQTMLIPPTFLEIEGMRFLITGV